MAELKTHNVELELDQETSRGNYANLAIISHSSSEFVLDFAAVLPGLPKAKIRSRIILAPEHAKRLLLSLQDNITRYESAVGRIEIPGMKGVADDEIVGFSGGEA